MPVLCKAHNDVLDSISIVHCQHRKVSPCLHHSPRTAGPMSFQAELSHNLFMRDTLAAVSPEPFLALG